MLSEMGQQVWPQFQMPYYRFDVLSVLFPGMAMQTNSLGTYAVTSTHH